jgi:hypothetical protein
MTVKRSTESWMKTGPHLALVEPSAYIQLSTEYGDLAIVPADQAEKIAKAFANKECVSVALRDPISDEVIATIEPQPQIEDDGHINAAADPRLLKVLATFEPGR